MAWFKLVGLSVLTVGIWEGQMLWPNLCFPSRQKLWRGWSCLLLGYEVWEEYKSFPRVSEEALRNLQLWGQWEWPGLPPWMGTQLNYQHFQLLCPNNVYRFFPPLPQVGIQQGRGEVIPYTCWWLSPGKKGGGSPSLRSLRTSDTQFSNMSQGYDLTESFTETGTHYLPKNPREWLSTGVPSYKACLTAKRVIPSSTPPTLKSQVLPWIQSEHGSAWLCFTQLNCSFWTTII